jgi:hypothetical protein
MFNPLATYYSEALDAHTRQSLGLPSVSNRDFSAIFYPAFDKTFSGENIRSRWPKTRIKPWDPAQVLEIFDKGLLCTDVNHCQPLLIISSMPTYAGHGRHLQPTSVSLNHSRLCQGKLM